MNLGARNAKLLREETIVRKILVPKGNGKQDIYVFGKAQSWYVANI